MIIIKREIKEWMSYQLEKYPGRVVLAIILLFNVIFILISTCIIKSFALSGTEHMNFLQAAVTTISMILDAGCIQFVIGDIGIAETTVSIICLIIIIVGMISFTGAVIGYVTNYISDFIGTAYSGERKLQFNDHFIILNWNSRGSEIVNDLLYYKKNQKVVILVENNKDSIMQEIEERLQDTINKENEKILNMYAKKSFLVKKYYFRKYRFKKNVKVLIREGNVYSSKQLSDIALDKAQTIVILGNDINNSICKMEQIENIEKGSKGNSQTIKTLMQVSDITSANSSADNQKIIVEITDKWTLHLVKKIIENKQVNGKCNIVPVAINTVLGQILSQFSIMPELNLAYKELFSNKGMTFYFQNLNAKDENMYIQKYLENHKYSLPLASMNIEGKNYFYYAAEDESYINHSSLIKHSQFNVKLNNDYWIEPKTVIVLGHNSKCKEIMEGFKSFVGEWSYKNSDKRILNVIVIDEEKNFEKMNYYEDYPFVVDTIKASTFEKEKIINNIEKIVDNNEEDTSILILSDDTVLNSEIDANVFTNLIYVQEIINNKKKTDPLFDENSIDVIVEIINPKHFDIVQSYCTNNVVMSNRYISKMITQIGEKDALYHFYTDILKYDDEDVDEYDSKEIYAKKVNTFFREIPKECTAKELIDATYKASLENDLNDYTQQNICIVLGYVKSNGKIILFNGNQEKIKVNLEKDDKLIVYSDH